MRRTASAIALACVLTLDLPGFAQPFSDVSADHWAYDAIAELAAKGLVEGYPDGTFKGGRAMTRYEMAMVVARLLAQIESIQIPAPAPAPQVTKADLDTVLRLINEYRPELTNLLGRRTPIEEELNAIKAKLDNVRITGRLRLRYDSQPSVGNPCATVPCPTSLNGNPNTGTIDSGGSPVVFRARMGGKLIIDGSVAPDIHAIISLELSTGATSAPATFDSAGSGSGAAAGCNSFPCYQFANIANLYLDWAHAWGGPVRIQIGRMGWIQNSFGADVPDWTYKIKGLQFGPYGLLLSTGSSTYGASNGNTGTQIWDGLRLSGKIPLTPVSTFNWQAAGWRVVGPTDGSTYFLGEDAYGIDGNVKINLSQRRTMIIGGYYVANSINAASSAFPANATTALWHVYGNPGQPLVNPPTSMCPAVASMDGGLPEAAGGGKSQGGIRCHALGSGVGAYFTWDVAPRRVAVNGNVIRNPVEGQAAHDDGYPTLRLDGEVATWNDRTAGISDSAYYVDVVLDLGSMKDITRNLTLSYENAGVNFYAPYQNDVDHITLNVGPGNAQLFNADLTFEFTDSLGFRGAYASGNNVSNGMGITEWRVGVTYKFAKDAMIYGRIENQRIDGISQYTLYRMDLDFTL